MSQQANELFDNFQQLTPSEFFRKNKQMLGFTGKIRSLTIVFHELITNSFDAAEEAGILPEINQYWIKKNWQRTLHSQTFR